MPDITNETEADMSGGVPHAKPKDTTQIGDRKLKPSTLMMGHGYDPALSSYWARQCVDAGLPMVEITQRSMFFTQPLQEIEALVLAGKLRHDGNPAMTWMVGNLVVLESKYNELKSPTKNRKEDKIDGAMALLMALGRAMALAEPDTAAQRSKAFWASFAEETA